MKPFIKSISKAVALLSLTVSASHAQSIDQQYPLISGDNTGVTSFHPSTKILQAVSRPQIILTNVSTLQYIFPAPELGEQIINVQILVDLSDGSVSGVDGDDCEVIGAVDQNGDFVPDVSGVLLTGEIVDLIIEETGTTDVFDYRFKVTGGHLADSFPTGYFSVVNISENSDFSGSFNAPFTGEAKLTLGSVDQIEESDSDPEEDSLNQFEGLSPEFWISEQGQSEWLSSGVDRCANYNRMFSARLSCEASLWRTVSCSGEDLSAQFLSHSTAALLNAKHPHITYAYTPDEVLTLVEDAFTNRSYQEVVDELSYHNSLGANLNVDPINDDVLETRLAETCNGAKYSKKHKGSKDKYSSKSSKPSKSKKASKGSKSAKHKKSSKSKKCSKYDKS